MDPVSWFLEELLATVVVESSIGAVQGSVKTVKDLYESGDIPGVRAAAAFVISMLAWVSLGLTVSNPILVLRILIRVTGNTGKLISKIVDPGHEHSNPEDRKPRMITMDEAVELYISIKNLSPSTLEILIAISLLTSGIVFGITLLVDLAEAILKVIGGAVAGAIRRLGKLLRS